MDRIFSLADNVVAWLGPEAELSSHGMKTIKVMQDVAKSLNFRTVLDPDLTKTTSELTIKDKTRLQIEVIDCLVKNAMLGPGDIGCVMSIMTRPFFKRLWIIQELSLGRNVTLACGSERVSLESFHAAMTLLHWLRTSLFNSIKRRINQLITLQPEIPKLYELYSPFDPLAGDPPAVVHVSARVQQVGPALDIMELVMCTCEETNITASNPRDCVYALLGLMKQQDRDCITVDYQDPHICCFSQVTRLLLTQYGPTVLAFSGMCARGSLSLPIPSWALDLTYTLPRTQLLLSSWDLKRSRDHFQYGASANHGITLKGFQLGQISFTLPYADEQGVESIWSIISRIMKRYEESHHHIEEKDWKYNLCQTLLYGKIPGHLGLSMGDIPSVLDRFIQQHTTSTEQTKAAIDTSPNPDACPGAMDDGKTVNFDQLLWNNEDRNLFILDCGTTGSGPPMTTPGDHVFAIKGSTIPFILRSDVEGIWKLVGPAFVPGVTHDESQINDFWSKVADKDITDIHLD